MPEKELNWETTFLSVAGETLFILLPMIVIGVVLGLRGEIHRLIYIPEWSLVNAVIVGQAVFKMFYGVLHFNTRHTGSLILTVAVAIVLLLVPTLIVLSFILVIPPDQVPKSLAIGQLVLFAAGLTLHIVVLVELQRANRPREDA